MIREVTSLYATEPPSSPTKAAGAHQGGQEEAADEEGMAPPRPISENQRCASVGWLIGWLTD